VIVALLLAAATPATPPVLVASHRSCWQASSENALDGIRLCKAAGIDIVEVDVRTTSDGVLVLMHDETVDRTTDGHGAVASLPARSIAALRLRRGGGGADAALTDRRVPTLDQALRATRGRTIVNLDVKAADIDRVIDTVVRAGMGRRVLLNVPCDVDAAIVDRARRAGVVLQPVYIERSAGLSVEQALAPWRDRPVGAVQLVFDDPTLLDRARAVLPQTRIFVNTMAYDIATGSPMRLSATYLDTTAITHPDRIWGGLIRHGVSIIQTDQPLQLRAWLGARTGAAAK